MNKKLKKILGCTEFYVFLLIVVVGLLIQARSGQFFTSNNIVDIASAMIVPGIFAVGIFMVLVSGGMDVSFPALASLSAYATTKLLLNMGYEGTVLVPIAIAAVIGALLGAFNGYFIGYLNLPPMIITLGASSVFKGFMQGALNSKQLAVIPEDGTKPRVTALGMDIQVEEIAEHRVEWAVVTKLPQPDEENQD